MPLPLLTERLRLRAFVPEDAEALHRLVSGDPEVMRYRHIAVAATTADARPFLEFLIGHQRTRGFSLWAVEDRRSGSLLGQCGLIQVRGPIEIAYSFGRAHWGRGYATEAAHASLDFGSRELGLAPIVAFMDPANVGSRRVAEKIGMRFDGTARLAGVDHLRYVSP